jgi:hypothetical protein
MASATIAQVSSDVHDIRKVVDCHDDILRDHESRLKIIEPKVDEHDKWIHSADKAMALNDQALIDIKDSLKGIKALLWAVAGGIGTGIGALIVYFVQMHIK